MQRLLLGLGLLLLVLGLVWPYLPGLPFGRLPGDILIERRGGRFYLPLASCLVLSCVVSFLLWLFRR